MVAIRYAAGDLPTFLTVETLLHAIDDPTSSNATKYDVYKAAPTPDLINLITRAPEVQMVVYWAVFASGIFYLLLFIWNSIEMRTERA